MNLETKSVGSVNTEKDETFTYTTKKAWYIIILLGIQHFLTMCTPNAIASLILINSLCLENDSPVKSELISTSFFVMGISTLLQSTLGCRLPIIQGATYSILIPTIALMNIPELNMCNISENKFLKEHFRNITMPQSTFHLKIRLINGALMATSAVEILVAVTGCLSILTKLISPLSLAAIYTVLSMAISESLLNMIAKQWGIGLLSILLITLFSIVLAPKLVPIPIWTRKLRCHTKRIKIFQISPIIIALLIIWLFCGILTVSGALSKDPKGWGYGARTDTKLKAFYESNIFKFPYPTQWGMPLVVPSAVVGMSAGIIISVIESISDYIITAETIKAPKIPQFAINRGILMEGISVFLSGLLGSAVGPTSFTDNIGLMKITKAGNVFIAQVAAVAMLLCGIFPIIGALFVSIPDPAIGGITFIVALMIMDCVIGNLNQIKINSIRNAMVYGFSVAFGIYLPYWTKKNASMLTVGYKPIDEIIQIVLSINLFIAAVISIFLDNVLPGTCRKEIVIECNKGTEQNTHINMSQFDICLVYDWKALRWIAIKFPFLQYFPLFPAYRKINCQSNMTPNDCTEITTI